MFFQQVAGQQLFGIRHITSCSSCSKMKGITKEQIIGIINIRMMIDILNAQSARLIIDRYCLSMLQPHHTKVNEVFS